MGEKKPEWQWLDGNILADIFTRILHADKSEYCAHCARPYYWVVGNPQALALRSVCSHWRRSFLRGVLIYGFTQPRLMWCAMPQACARNHLRWVHDRMSECRPIFHIVTRLHDGMIENYRPYNRLVDSEEEEFSDEGTTQEESDSSEE